MPYKRREATCQREECAVTYMKGHAKQKYCTISCAVTTQHRMMKDSSDYVEYREKNAAHLRSMNANLDKKAWSEKIGKASRRSKNVIPNNIFECSSRTRIKILARLDVSCCVCGWKEDTCDLHHIEGRNINDPHNHTNLTVLCPNHHRLCHKGKIPRESLKTVQELYGDAWKDVYYM